MKYFTLLVFFAMTMASCHNHQKDDAGQESTGDINDVTIVIDDPLWNGEVGDSIRKKLASPIEGLFQEEPLFTINQCTTKATTDFFCHNRNIVIIKKANANAFSIKEDEFAKNQTVIHITGKNIPELISLIEKKSDTIIKRLKQGEILECQKRSAVAALDCKKIIERFRVSLKIPSAYTYAVTNDHFIWLKKEIPSGNASILIYQVPMSSILKDQNVIQHIVKNRDSIGNLYVHGTQAGSYMISEESYSPYIQQIKLEGRKAFETKGRWEMKNDFMSGSFQNYTIIDEKNKRILVIEGFAYAPSIPNRDIMYELESIVKSVKFF